MAIYRCEACGNKTRFDFYETKKVRSFHHFSLAGEDSIEEEEVFERSIDKIVCRWCGSTTVVEEAHSGSEAK